MFLCPEPGRWWLSITGAGREEGSSKKDAHSATEGALTPSRPEEGPCRSWSGAAAGKGSGIRPGPLRTVDGQAAVAASRGRSAGERIGSLRAAAPEQEPREAAAQKLLHGKVQARELQEAVEQNPSTGRAPAGVLKDVLRPFPATGVCGPSILRTLFRAGAEEVSTGLREAEGAGPTQSPPIRAVLPSPSAGDRADPLP